MTTVIPLNDCPPEAAIDWQAWLDKNLVTVLGNLDAYTFEAIWDSESLRKTACQYLLALGHHRVSIPCLHQFNREFATCGDTVLEQSVSLMEGNVSSDEAIDMAIFAGDAARATWPEIVRHKANELRAAVLDAAPEWGFVKTAYADACERAEEKKNCSCRFSGGCVGC